MSEQPAPILQTGQILPAFTLPGADGMPHSPWDYKQRENLILLFTRSSTSSETRGLLRAFATAYTSFREELCALLAITPNPVLNNTAAHEALHLPFPLLADPDSTVISRYTFWDDKSCHPALILADRYGALYQQWIVDREAALPSISELLETLRYLNSLCTP
jgi:peroxiredoxin